MQRAASWTRWLSRLRSARLAMKRRGYATALRRVANIRRFDGARAGSRDHERAHPRRGTDIARGSIVIEDGRIVSVAAGAATAAPAIRRRRRRRKHRAAGLHRRAPPHHQRRPEQWFREQSVARMQEFLDAGFTTLMSGGGPMPGIMELKRRIDSGELKGPRVITSGRADPRISRPTEEARAQVRSLAAAGVEIIKASVTPAEKAMLAVDRRRSAQARPRRHGARRHGAGDDRRHRSRRSEARAHAARQLPDERAGEDGRRRRHREPVDRRFCRARVRRVQRRQRADVSRRQPVAVGHLGHGLERRRREARQRAHAVGQRRRLRFRHRHELLAARRALSRAQDAELDVLAARHRQAHGTEHGRVHRDERRLRHDRAGQDRGPRRSSTAIR